MIKAKEMTIFPMYINFIDFFDNLKNYLRDDLKEIINVQDLRFHITRSSSEGLSPILKKKEPSFLRTRKQA